MNNTYKFIVLISVIILAGFFINAISSDEKIKENTTTQTTNDPEKNTSEYYEIKALKLPKEMNFAGEEAPLQKNDILERIDRELLVNTYWQSNGLLMFKRAHKYFPIIEPILKQNGIPNDFKYLAVIESGLQNAISPSGAKGFWQIMKATGREYGLEVNENVDERYHLEKSTKVACKYLKESKQRFGSWTLAAAAYNAGNKRISDRLEQQKVDDYYDLLLNSETARYLPRILAVKEILSHPKKYGFSFEKDDLYRLEPSYEIKLDTAITDIAGFSKTFNMNYKEMKMLNPWLRERHLNNKSRREYTLKIKR